MGSRLTGYPRLRDVLNGADVADPATTLTRDATTGTTSLTLSLDGTTVDLVVDSAGGLTLTARSAALPDGDLLRLPEGLTRRVNTLLRDTGCILQPDWRTNTNTLRTGVGERHRLVNGQAISARLNQAAPSPQRGLTVAPVQRTVAPTAGATPADVYSGLSDHGALSGEVIVPDDVRAKWDAVNAMHRAGLPSNLMLQGPPGTGKTHMALALSAAEGRRVIEHGCMGMVEPSDWFGPQGFADGQTTFTPTPFYWALAMEGPRTLVLDEVSRASTVALNALLGVLGGNRVITLPHNGQQLVIPPDLKVVMTANIGPEYAGGSAIDKALTDRLTMTANVPYLPPADEQRLLVERMAHHGLTLEPWQAERLVQFATEVRSQANRNGDLDPVSPRELLAAAGAVASGAMGLLEAVEAAIVSNYSTTGGEASARTAVAVVAGGIDWRDPEALAAQAAAEAEANVYYGPHEMVSPLTGATVACVHPGRHRHGGRGEVIVDGEAS